MIHHIDQDLWSWAEWLEGRLERSNLSFPHRSTIAALADGVGRSSVPGPRVPHLDGSRYNRALSRAIAKLPDGQHAFLLAVYLRQARPGFDGKSKGNFRQKLHRVHHRLVELMRE